MRVILDTDFLVNAIKYKIHIEESLKNTLDSNFQICIIDKTLDELKKIKDKNAKIALQLIKLKKYKILKTKKDKITDDLIKEIAKKTDIVATQDRKLKKDLKQNLIKTLSIRQKKYIK
jgi:rRNA-processing protein FCF1